MGPVLAKFALSYKRKKREADSINWEGGERERERELNQVTRTRIQSTTRPDRISRFQPPHPSSKVPIKSLEVGHHFPTIITVKKWPGRWRSSFVAYDFSTLLCRDFCCILDVPPVGFCSSVHPHHFLSSPITWNSLIATDQPLEESRLWELDPPPLLRMGGHYWHHWTQLS